MTALITILTIIAIATLVYLLFLRKRKKTSDTQPINQQTVTNENYKVITETEVEEIFTDEYGEYTLENQKTDIPRKTYIIGQLQGKYWGEFDLQKREYQYSQFYNFHIYEVKITTEPTTTCNCLTTFKNQCGGLHTEDEGKFEFEPGTEFPRERLPHLLPVIIKKDGKEYAVNIYEPQLANVKFVSKLHQTEGKEVYGTVNAIITGHLLDFITEENIIKVYTSKSTLDSSVPSPKASDIYKTNTPTGKVEFKKNYERVEYYYSDYKTSYWGAWKYIPTANTNSGFGCMSSLVWTIIGIVGIGFLIFVLPKVWILIPFVVIFIAIKLIPSETWNWLYGSFSLLLFAGFIYAIITSGKSCSRYIPRPKIEDSPEERKADYKPIVDTINQHHINDTIISHYRKWEDYDGNEYEGNFWVKKSALQNSTAFKNNLNTNDYPEIVYNLSEKDKDDLQGIYTQFDSIKTTLNLNEHHFAEVIVSFVQDIPYTLVLDNACDASLYSDNFIRNYLRSDKPCDGFQKFGINTPVEFIGNLNGDCDTRTLLIYTILSHYNYDVAMLTSEYYSHSIIGINLPYEGLAYTYNDQRYTVWETTVPNIRPGVLPNDFSNLNYWAITIKSK